MTMHSTLKHPKNRGAFKFRSADLIQYPDINPKYLLSHLSGTDMATLMQAIRIQRRVAQGGLLKVLLSGEMPRLAMPRPVKSLKSLFGATA